MYNALQQLESFAAMERELSRPSAVKYDIYRNVRAEESDSSSGDELIGQDELEKESEDLQTKSHQVSIYWA